MEYPARSNGVATASKPRGAVASLLAKEGKKKTIFFDIRAFRYLPFLKIRFGSRRFVTGMSPDCQLFGTHAQSLCFHARVKVSMAKLHLINRAALPFRAQLFLAGMYCSFATDSAAILGSISRWNCSDWPEDGRTVEMDVLLDPSLPCDRDVRTQTHFRGLHHLVFATIGTHELFTFDLLRRRVIGAVSLASASDAAFWNTQWLPITVGLMGTTVGVAPLHSACLDFDGKGLLVAGVSGAGKSTLSIALAQCGFSLVSDDWTYLSKEDGKLIAHGLSVPVKLLPDAVRHFPELRPLVPRTSFNGELAFEVSPEEVWPVHVKSSSRPQWLIFLERRSIPGCDFIPYDVADAREFFEKSAERLPDELPEASLIRSKLIQAVANCQCWCVRSGEPPQATAEAIQRFCEAN
jgi:hypothetical protein